MNLLPDWMLTLQTPLPGESPGEHLARIINAFVGCSLSTNRDRLNDLFLANEASPQQAANVAAIQTNCGTSLRAMLALAGCTNSYIANPYKIGMAISDLLIAATQCGALITAGPNSWQQLNVGYIIHYCGAPGTDHVEMCLSIPDPVGVATHCGGGRANNEIGPAQIGDIRHSLGRPIVHIIDINKMGLPVVPMITPPAITDPVGPTHQDPAPVPAPPVQPQQIVVQPKQSIWEKLSFVRQGLLFFGATSAWLVNEWHSHPAIAGIAIGLTIAAAAFGIYEWKFKKKIS